MERKSIIIEIIPKEDRTKQRNFANCTKAGRSPNHNMKDRKHSMYVKQLERIINNTFDVVANYLKLN